MRLILTQPKLQAFDSQYNLDAIETLVLKLKGQYRPDDILLLPEHFTDNSDIQVYSKFLHHLPAITGCTIVGGSHHRNIDGKQMNAGTIIQPDGKEVGTYTKLRPYFHELKHITPGSSLGEFTINGKNLLVLICADFWYSDLILRATKLPDIILVPSLSVSRKPTADYSRTLWRHLAITRAYEFGVYIGISDWSEDSSLPKYRTCGVGGFADPTRIEPEKIFTPISNDGIAVVDLDFNALEQFRNDRKIRGFYWK